MSVNHRPPSLETRPLLDQRPTTYDSTNDVNSEVPPPGNSESLQPVSSSRIDPWILGGIWTGTVLAAFDGTVMATLLTPIGSRFNASDTVSLLGTSYLLSTCLTAPLYGRLSDILGRKWTLLLALSLFGSGTMLCGVAQSMKSFIAGRVVAGMGGGGLPTVTSIILSDIIPFRRRGLYQGMSNIAFGLGAALGGPIGGWANDTLGWRWAFHIQAPIIILNLVVVAVKLNIQLPDEIQQRPLLDKLRRMDYLGSITLAGALGCFFLAINFGVADEMQWTRPLVILLFASSACFAFSFVMIEQYWAPYPLLPSQVLLRRVPLAIFLSSFFLSMTVFSMLYSVPMYFSVVRSHPSAVSGLYLLPHSIVVPMGSLFAGWYMTSTGKLYLLTINAALFVLLPSVLASLWNKNTPEYHLWLDLLPQALGFSCFITSTLIALLIKVRKEEEPIAIGAIYVCRTTGHATGVSLGGAVIQSVLLRKLRSRISGPGSEEIIYSIRHSAQIIPSLEPLLRHAAIESYADALRVVFICQVAIGLLGVLPCLLIEEESPIPERHPTQDSNSP